MKIDGRPVLVTGGAGFIGSSLVRELLERGCDVRVVDDLSAGRVENLPSDPRLEFRRADVRDSEAMASAVAGADVVIHLAASPLRLALATPLASHEINAGGTLTLLEAAARASVARFLYCSSSEVYGTAAVVPMREDHPTRPTTVYGASKLAGEWYALSFAATHGLSVSVARPFNAYGPRAHHEGMHGELIPKAAVRALSGSPPLIFGDGSQTRDFTFVEDTVEGLILATESDALPGRAANIAFGREVPVTRIVELVCEACGVDLAPTHQDPRPADVSRQFADVALARRVLGFGPRVPVEDGIPRYVDWVRSTFPNAAAPAARETGRNWMAPSP